MKVENKPLTILLSLGVLILAGFAYAWTEPIGNPPTNNTSAPITIMGGQIVEGGLLLGNNPAITNGLLIRNGNVGIGELTPSVKLDVRGQIKSTLGGFVFPDGTVQTSAAASASSKAWLTTAGPCSSSVVPAPACPAGWIDYSGSIAGYDCIAGGRNPGKIYMRSCYKNF